MAANKNQVEERLRGIVRVHGSSRPRSVFWFVQQGLYHETDRQSTGSLASSLREGHQGGLRWRAIAFSETKRLLQSALYI